MTDPSDASDLADGLACVSAPSGNVNEASDAEPKKVFQFSESTDIGPADSELRSEMLELLSIFQVVYENTKSAVNTPSLLK